MKKIPTHPSTPLTKNIHSVILQKSVTYQGPISTKRLNLSNTFSRFKTDGLYCYPTLSFTSTKTMNNHAIIPSTEFFYIDSPDLTEKINEICQKSPFKTLEHTSPEITYSSINTVDFGIERYDSESNRLNTTKKELVSQILQEMSKKEEQYQSDVSVNLDISVTESNLSANKKQSFETLSSRSIFNVSLNTLIPTNEEELITGSKDSYIVELVPENTSILPTNQSIDSSGLDEGSILISTRMFLPKVYASKNLMDALPHEGEVVNYSNLISAENPDVVSPIIPKLLFCKKVDSRTSEIYSCIACSGYSLLPTLEFSGLEDQSRGVIFYKSLKKLEIFSQRIARELSGKSVSWITFGFEHCCVLTSRGEVFSWGYGASGCLGHGSLLSSAIPSQISRLPRCIYIQSGAYHNSVLTENEELFVWGRGDVNQLGLPPRLLMNDHMGCFTSVPTKVEFFNGKKVKSVACGEAHTLALDSNGIIYSFGWAEDGQLGLPSSWLKDKYMSFSPKQIVYLKHKKISKVAAGAVFSVALTAGGEVFVWGNGEQGQLGLGNHRKNIEIPSVVEGLQNEVILDLACGENSVICLSKGGTLYGWGQGCAGIFETKGSQFPYGSDLVCYMPRKLCEIDISYRLVIN